MTDAVRVPDDVIVRELNGEAIILDVVRGEYFGLDHVGTRIWQLCEEHGSIHAVWEALQLEFDAPSEELRSVLLEFVNELSSKGLLTRR